MYHLFSLKTTLKFCFPLQVDYESEEEDVGDDAEDKEDHVEEEEEEKVESSTLEEAPPVSAETRVERKKKKKRAKRGGEQEGGGESLSQMRVNSVLESNPAIERYCYDHQHELWCEVSFCVSAQKHERDSS